MRRYAMQVLGRGAIVALALTVLGAVFVWGRIGADRVIKVSARYPTETKPQSKLWYAQGRWWAWLPDRNGSSIWVRGETGWERIAYLDDWLSRIPGHADVWADDEGVTSVLVSPRQITVAQIVFDRRQQKYVPRGEPTVWRHSTAGSQPASQCATIARDGDGRYWIAYDLNGFIRVRRTRGDDPSVWEKEIVISEKLDRDDLSVIAPLGHGIGVAWTDQSRDVICFRRHVREQPYKDWEPVEIVAEGPAVANNHLSATVGRDGTVYLASKTNRYVPGEPPLFLRVRSPAGTWQQVPIAEYTTANTPTRPIVLLNPNEKRIWIVHTLLDNSAWNAHAIVSCAIDRHSLAPRGPANLIVEPHLDLQNATSCKNGLAKDHPWIVLASDRWGNVYEGEVSTSGE